MCTVTYLPQSNQHFILTHNRDEHFTRGIALLPEKRRIHNTEVLYPIDPDAGGTWIAASHLFTLCLLNGGFVRHQRQLPYRHSRGQIILDFFLYQNVNHFVKDYPFENLEPFTLIIVDHANGILNELVFDGKVICRDLLNVKVPHIWSSTTLYTELERETRRFYFQRFLAAGKFSQEDIINFHKNKFEPYQTEGIQINRNDILKTVSLTSIVKADIITMFYEDFVYPQTVTIAL